MKQAAAIVAAVLILLALSTVCSATDDIRIPPDAPYCFAADDFGTGDSAPDGIFLTAIPAPDVASVRYGNRLLRAGDVLPKQTLPLLTLTPSTANTEASVFFYPISGGNIGALQELKFSILSGRNEAPVSKDSQFETYKNIPNSGSLDVRDPEDGMLTYQLVREPKRGTVELASDGTFTYTPNENKVGKDSFVFTATDEAGNVSEQATVSIQILKPTDAATYADMTGDTDEFPALWMKNTGLFTGETLAGRLCFNPDDTVSRSEFLIMTMKLFGTKTADAKLTSGFVDEKELPVWMRPYLVSAMRSGMITGVNSEEGMVFRPSADMTRAEASVLLQNILELPVSTTSEVFSADSAIPAWAERSVAALSGAGITIDRENATAPITRRETATILYEVSKLLKKTDRVPRV